MTEAEWKQLCDLLDLAIDDQRQRDNATDDDLVDVANWYVLMGARRITHARHFSVRYPSLA